MSGLGDAVTALKNVMLLSERLERVQSDVAVMSRDVSGLKDYIVSVDKRVSRLEGMIEGAALARRSLPKE